MLLASGRAVTDTALACGWANPTSFIDAFTAVLGQTPGRYRSQLNPAGKPAARNAAPPGPGAAATVRP